MLDLTLHRCSREKERTIHGDISYADVARCRMLASLVKKENDHGVGNDGNTGNTDKLSGIVG